MSYFGTIYADTELPSRAKAVYMYLRDRSDSEGKCWPGINTIASDMKLSRSTVKRDSFMIWSSTDIWRRLPGIEPTVAAPPICTPSDKAAKSAALRQWGAALTCWPQGRFMVDLPEGLTLTEY